MMSIEHVIQLMYPYTILLGHEGKMAVEGVLKVSTCFSFLSVLFISLSFPFPRFSCPSFLFTLLFFLCLPFSPLPREEALDASNKKAVVGNTLLGVCMAGDSGLLQGANDQQSNQRVNILIVAGITGSYWRRVIKMKWGRHEQRRGLLAPEHEEQTKGTIPPKSSVVPQGAESRLLAGAQRIYSWPHTGVGPVGLVQGLMSTLDVPSGRCL